MCQPETTSIEKQCSTAGCVNEEPEAPVDIPESKWVHLADSFLIIAFAVGVYAQIFSFFLYAFTSDV